MQFLQKFGLREGVPGTHPHAKFYCFGFINVGLQPEKSLKLVIFGIYFPQRGISPSPIFLQNLAWGRVSQVPTITLTFTFVALKMWPYGRQNRKKIAIFGINCP